MTDQPASSPAFPPVQSYVDSYQPPHHAGAQAPASAAVTAVDTPVVAADDESVSEEPYYQSMNNPGVVSQPTVTEPPANTSSAPTYQAAPAPALATEPTAAAAPAQGLEAQNIFVLLGITDGNDEDKEQFLDQLQQVIWEDFLSHDVEMLITSEEMSQLRQIMSKAATNELELQEEIIGFLEPLIPDLEEIMLEKALELKEDMARERVAGLRQYYANQPEKMQQIEQAEAFMVKNQWATAADVLNAIT